MAIGLLPRIQGAIPAKSAKMPAPRPGVAVPKQVSAVAKILTARVTGTAPKLQPVAATIPAAQLAKPRQPPARQAPITAGAMPRKVFTNPKAAVPMRPRAPGANRVNPTVFDRLTRGRILQRGTR